MSVDTFISAVKDKRNDALDVFEDKVRELGKDKTNDGADVLKGAAVAALDYLAGGILDVVEEQYESLVIAIAIDSEGEEVDVSLGITADLSTLFFEEINN